MIYAVVGDTILIDINKAFSLFAETIADMALTFIEATFDIEEFVVLFKAEPLIKTQPLTISSNYIPKVKRALHWPALRRNYFIRILFPLSGYLPRRIRRKRKDKQ